MVRCRRGFKGVVETVFGCVVSYGYLVGRWLFFEAGSMRIYRDAYCHRTVTWQWEAGEVKMGNNRMLVRVSLPPYTPGSYTTGSSGYFDLIFYTGYNIGILWPS